MNVSTEKKLQPEERQAVLLADDQLCACDIWEHGDHQEEPLSLLPVASIPLLRYSLESLSRAGIRETFLFCTHRVDLIRKYIDECVKERAAWSVSMVVHVIASETCRSPGDALRELDAKGHIRGHFVLLGVNTVFNAGLVPLLERHKEICAADRGAVMTIACESVLPGHGAESSRSRLLLVADSETDRVLHHRKFSRRGRKERRSFPIEMFLDCPDVVVRNDLVDVDIAVCSPAVLPLFADNFDFQTRDDFVKGILMNEEILASTIYWHPLGRDRYAARVSDWRSYRTVSQDILHRWTYPLVPDKICLENDYMLLRNDVYRSRDVSLGKNCELKEDSLIARKCTVKEETRIERSIVGENCHIGKGCLVVDSYLLGDVRVGDGCIIRSSVIGKNCVIDGNCRINTCIVFSNVRLDAETVVDSSHIRKNKTGKVFKKISERAYIVENDNDDESLASDESEREKNGHDDNLLTAKRWDDRSDVYSTSSEEDSSRSASPVAEDTNLFLEEVVDSLARGFEEKLNCDNLILEINSSRYAYNISLQEVNFFVVRALFNLPHIKSSSNVLVSFKDLLGYFMPIIMNYIKGSDAMMDCLRAVEESCISDALLNNKTGQIVHLLYEKDVIEEDIILKWFDVLKNEKSPISRENALVKLIDWLQQASEESEDSDE